MCVIQSSPEKQNQNGSGYIHRRERERERDFEALAHMILKVHVQNLQVRPAGGNLEELMLCFRSDDCLLAEFPPAQGKPGFVLL